MTHSEAPISINLKTLSGTQLTLRAETPDEFTQITAFISQIVEAIQEVETAVRPVNTAVPFNPAIASVADAFNATGLSVVPNTPDMGARNCPHGTMTRIHGLTGKFGPYKGHFCPAQMGDPSKCIPANVYVKQGSQEWNTFIPNQTKQ